MFTILPIVGTVIVIFLLSTLSNDNIRCLLTRWNAIVAPERPIVWPIHDTRRIDPASGSSPVITDIADVVRIVGRQLVRLFAAIADIRFEEAAGNITNNLDQLANSSCRGYRGGGYVQRCCCVCRHTFCRRLQVHGNRPPCSRP